MKGHDDAPDLAHLIDFMFSGHRKARTMNSSTTFSDLTGENGTGKTTAVRYGLVAAVAIAALLIPWSAGECGPVFDRVTKSGTVRLGVPYNRIPQGFLKPSGEWVGFEMDLASEIAKHLNLKLETVKVNDQTWGTMLTRGRIDAALCRIKHTRSLENTFDFSVPYFFDSLNILVLKGSFKATEDLKGSKIAAVQGSPSEKTAMRLLKAAGDQMAEKNVVSFPDRPTCFMALGQGKVSGWLDSGMTLIEYSSRSPGRFELVSASDAVEEVAVALPQDDSAWRDLVNFAIQDMAADGSFKKIYDQWFGSDTPYAFPAKRSIDVWPQ
jgi:polar amino acid transport system substrate-binding protein